MEVCIMRNKGLKKCVCTSENTPKNVICGNLLHSIHSVKDLRVEPVDEYDEILGESPTNLIKGIDVNDFQVMIEDIQDAKTIKERAEICEFYAELYAYNTISAQLKDLAAALKAGNRAEIERIVHTICAA